MKQAENHSNECEGVNNEKLLPESNEAGRRDMVHRAVVAHEENYLQ